MMVLSSGWGRSRYGILCVLKCTSINSVYLWSKGSPLESSGGASVDKGGPQPKQIVFGMPPEGALFAP